MASDVAAMPVNGNYAAHHAYGSADQQQQQNSGAFGANNVASLSSYGQAPPPSSSTPGPAAPPAQQEIPKDEVGWYFVEQYYTTLSRSPEKLYLFYNKRSQFVSGQETDKVAVCVGQRAINDRIKELDFQDCKVRVTNVDSQASDANIVIQVIGEISNKSQPHKKFTQTFVLATQTNGYFVLNDIFRYIIEEEDEPEPEPEPEAIAAEEELQQVPPAKDSGIQEPPSIAAEVEPKTLTSSEDPKAIENDAQQVDKELQEKVLDVESQPRATSAAINGEGEPDKDEVAHAEDAPAAATEPVQTDAPELAQAETVEDLKPEAPADPKPTPSASPPKQAPPQPAAAPKPAVPKTWANLAAAANRSAVPVVPAAPSTATPAASQPRPSAPATKATPPAAGAPSAAPSAPSAAPSAPAAQREPSPAAGGQDEWTAVGGSHNRQQSRQTNGQQQDAPQWRGYIKNVHEGVDATELRKTLEQSGELIYFDIARQKNCAFVDFKTKEGYDAAIANSPHTISNERLYVEERRFKPGATPYVQRGQFQGGRGRGAGNQNTTRGGFQGRGAFPHRAATRGGAPPRGRGGPQAA